MTAFGSPPIVWAASPLPWRRLRKIGIGVCLLFAWGMGGACGDPTRDSRLPPGEYDLPDLERVDRPETEVLPDPCGAGDNDGSSVEGDGGGDNGEWGECVPPVASACVPDPCRFGRCVASGAGGFRCDCDRGYTGFLCDACDTGFERRGLVCVALGVCTDFPCVFGTCRDVGGSAVCECQPGYDGPLCDRCAPDHLLVEGRCQPR